MHTDFICYVLEEYKAAKGLDAKTAISIFIKNDILNYLRDCYGALHTVSPDVLISDIDEIAAARI